MCSTSFYLELVIKQIWGDFDSQLWNKRIWVRTRSRRHHWRLISRRQTTWPPPQPPLPPPRSSRRLEAPRPPPRSKKPTTTRRQAEVATVAAAAVLLLVRPHIQMTRSKSPTQVSRHWTLADSWFIGNSLNFCFNFSC